jgi:hypothetical protein
VAVAAADATIDMAFALAGLADAGSAAGVALVQHWSQAIATIDLVHVLSSLGLEVQSQQNVADVERVVEPVAGRLGVRPQQDAGGTVGTPRSQDGVSKLDVVVVHLAAGHSDQQGPLAF